MRPWRLAFLFLLVFGCSQSAEGLGFVEAEDAGNQGEAQIDGTATDFSGNDLGPNPDQSRTEAAPNLGTDARETIGPEIPVDSLAPQPDLPPEGPVVCDAVTGAPCGDGMKCAGNCNGEFWCQKSPRTPTVLCPSKRDDECSAGQACIDQGSGVFSCWDYCHFREGDQESDCHDGRNCHRFGATNERACTRTAAYGWCG